MAHYYDLTDLVCSPRLLQRRNLNAQIKRAIEEIQAPIEFPHSPAQTHHQQVILRILIPLFLLTTLAAEEDSQRPPSQVSFACQYDPGPIALEIVRHLAGIVHGTAEGQDLEPVDPPQPQPVIVDTESWCFLEAK